MEFEVSSVFDIDSLTINFYFSSFISFQLTIGIHFSAENYASCIRYSAERADLHDDNFLILARRAMHFMAQLSTLASGK